MPKNDCSYMWLATPHNGKIKEWHTCTMKEGHLGKHKCGDANCISTSAP
jgi:hypothetical protein